MFNMNVFYTVYFGVRISFLGFFTSGSAVTVRAFVPEQICAVSSSVLHSLGESSRPAGVSLICMIPHKYSYAILDGTVLILSCVQLKKSGKEPRAAAELVLGDVSYKTKVGVCAFCKESV